MADYDLGQMAKASGIRIAKLLGAIEVTQSLEDDLYAILYPIINAYRQQIGYVEDAWSIGVMTRAAVESILQTAFTPARVMVERVEPQLQGWSERVEAWQRRRWVGTVKAATRLNIEPILAQGDVRDLVTAQTKTNVSLIKNLSGETESRIERDVWKAYADGTNGRDLAKQLRDTYDFAPARARLIAYDQLGKFSGSLDKARHTQAGLDKYHWKTVGDDRVRPTHKANAIRQTEYGVGVYEYGHPPPNTGEPGQDIRCRCKAQAILFTGEEEAQLEAMGLGGLT